MTITEHPPALAPPAPPAAGDERDRSGADTPAAAAPPAAHRTVDTGLVGALLAAALVVGAAGASVVGLGHMVLYGYPLGAVVLAVGLLLTSRWYSYLSLSVVVWLASYGVRRVVDWQTTFHTASPILVTGSLVSLVALPWALRGRRQVYRDVRLAVSVVAAVVVFGLLVGSYRNGLRPAVADLLLLGAPIVTGLFVLSVPGDDGRLARLVQGTALWGCLLLGGYGVLQFFVLPAWDAAWIVDSGITSVGKAEPGQFRIFSTLGTTGPLGYVMAVLLLLLVAERRVSRQALAAGVGLLASALTLIRGGWIGLVLGVVALTLLGRPRVLRLAGLVAVLVVVVASVPGPVHDSVTGRVDRTASAGTQDTSLQQRLAFQSSIAPQTFSRPVGDGLGATGVASDLGHGDLPSERYHNFDSGIFETLTRYGAVPGLAVLGILVWTLVQCLRRARYGTLLTACMAAATVGLVVGMVFTDTQRSVYGFVFWLLLGVQGRPVPADPARLRRPAGAQAP